MIEISDVWSSVPLKNVESLWVMPDYELQTWRVKFRVFQNFNENMAVWLRKCGLRVPNARRACVGM